ncbi:Uncharacterized protein dnl_22030 [Desulfonema limicola]|uniref:Uncharacterized protein n=1 Tax=Desulfonema limicola TaxID=45656 RepID=A0A975B6W8_9BACT|nr:hypothetical protein [Desulfonema limicola]QTA79921.1 Uncharacterized protein dnl_22030 [Desulfonema limicola]
MFYIGAFFSENYDQAILSIIRQTLKNVKKHYHLINLQYFKPGTDYFEIEKQLISLFNNKELAAKKRVFSQDRRPARNIKVMPGIVMNFWNRDTSKIDRLRGQNIPAEGISMLDAWIKDNQWEKEEYSTICLGHNYYTGKSDLLKALQKVIEQKRITIDNHLDTPGIYDLLYNQNQIKMKKDLDIIYAVSLPIWFKETIRIIKRY